MTCTITEDALAVQRAEFESLESIFADELTLLSQRGADGELQAPIHFSVAIGNHLCVDFTFPPLYPDEAPPEIALQLTSAMVGSSLSTLVKTLEEEISELRAQLVGSPSSLLVIARCQDFVQSSEFCEGVAKLEGKKPTSNNVTAGAPSSSGPASSSVAKGSGKRGAAALKKAVGASVETHSVEDDPTLHSGPLCTEEVFHEWCNGYLAEYRAAKEQEGKSAATKITGRALFESALKDTDWSLFDGEQLYDDEEFFDEDEE